MLSIVCSGEYNNDFNQWLDYYTHIGIRYIFFIGPKCPSEKMVHILSKKKKVKDGEVLSYMKKNSKTRAVKCYIHLKIGEYLRIPPILQENHFNYFYWCEGRDESFYIQSYDNKPRMLRFILDNKIPLELNSNILVQTNMPAIDHSKPCVKNLTKCRLNSSLFTVEMIDGNFNIPLAHEIFKRNGLVIVKNALPIDVMEEVSKESTKIITKYQKEIIQYYEDGTSFKANDKATEIACRPGSRVEIKTRAKQPFIDPEMIANEELLELLKLNLDAKRIEIDTIAAISSLPNSDYQHWHRDVPIIFPNSQKEFQLPAPGLIMVGAIEDVPLKKGPTNLIPSSNILSTSMNKIKIGNWSMEDVSCEINGYCVPELKKGDILMLDLRTLHRGGKNNSNEWRTIMYITYMNEWFDDRINFNTKQTKDFDEIEEESQLLLSRIDHEEYIQKLEDNCNENDIPISESNYEHGQRHNLVN